MMKKDKEIIEDFRKELKTDLLTEDTKGSQKTKKLKIVNLWLAPIDYPEECSAKKDILEELKQKGIILDFAITAEEIEWYPQKPSPLQKELYADEINRLPEALYFDEIMMIAKVTYDPHHLKVKLRKYHSTSERIIYTINIDKNSQTIIINGKERIDFSAKRGNKEIKEWKMFYILFEAAKRVKHSRYVSYKKLHKYSLRTLKEDIGAATIEAVEAAVNRLRKKLFQERLPIRFYVSKKDGLIGMVIELSDKSPQSSKQSTN